MSKNTNWIAKNEIKNNWPFVCPHWFFLFFSIFLPRVSLCLFFSLFFFNCISSDILSCLWYVFGCILNHVIKNQFLHFTHFAMKGINRKNVKMWNCKLYFIFGSIDNAAIRRRKKTTLSIEGINCNVVRWGAAN